MKWSSKKMRFLLKKFLAFEKSHNNKEGVIRVRVRIMLGLS